MGRIKSVADIRYGLGQPPLEKSDGLPMLRATNVNAGSITKKGLLFVDRDDLPLSRNPYLKAGEIIVVRSGAYTGDSAIVPSEYDGAVAGYDMVVTATKIDEVFLSYVLLSGYVLDAQILLLTLRAAQPHLNSEQLGSIAIVIPSTKYEQTKIAQYIQEEIAKVGKVKSGLIKQIRVLQDYKTSLIHECVTGKRRITDADLKKVA
jgi:type I restriction enzyme, S subunit